MPWRDDSGNIKKVVITEGVTTVADRAFFSCNQLTEVSLPETVTEIGESAFQRCYALEQISIPNSVTILGDSLFEDYSALEKVRILGAPAMSEEANGGCFEGCALLKSAGPLNGGYDLEFGWTEFIPRYAFSYMAGLERVVLPEGLNSIGNYAFASCAALAEVNIPASVTEIGGYLFKNTPALLTAGGQDSDANLKIGWTEKYLNGAFNSSNLVSAVVPEGVTELESSVFSGCTSLERLELPKTLTKIGSNAFYQCKSLKKLILPAPEMDIYSGALTELKALTTLGPLGSGCDLEVGWTGAVSYSLYGMSFTSVTLPEGVTEISAVFGSNQALTEVHLPQSLESIGSNTFSGCSALTQISLPENLKKLGGFAFEKSGLTSIDLPLGVSTIPTSAFSGCQALENVNAGAITSIAVNAFKDCAALKQLTVLGNPPGVNYAGFYNNVEQVFADAAEGFTIRYPSARTSWPDSAWNIYSLTPYEVDENLIIAQGVWGGADSDGKEWPMATWTLNAAGTLTVTGEGELRPGKTFADSWYGVRDNVSRLLISEGITALYDSSFYQFSNLTEAHLPDSLTLMEGRPFSQCQMLGKLNIPSGIDTFQPPFHANYAGTPELTGDDRSFANVLAELNGYAWVSSGKTAGTETVLLRPAGGDRSEADVAAELQSSVERNHIRVLLADGVYWISDTLSIKGYDVTLEAEHPGKVEILLTDGLKPVVQIPRNGPNLAVPGSYQYIPSIFVDLRGLILGHDAVDFKGESGCDGGEYYVSNADVIIAHSARKLTVENCDLWGCGIRALNLNMCRDVTVTGSVLRDCLYSAIYNYDSDLTVSDCVISGTAYDGKYAERYACLYFSGQDNLSVSFTGCRFFNNSSTKLFNYATAEERTTFTDCTFHDNAWQEGETPRNYGVCAMGGVTWTLEEENGKRVLRFGRSVSYSDGDRLESGKGTVPAYTPYSLPWKRLLTDTDRVELPAGYTGALGGFGGTLVLNYADTGLADGSYDGFCAVYDGNGRFVGAALAAVNISGGGGEAVFENLPTVPEGGDIRAILTGSGFVPTQAPCRLSGAGVAGT